MKQFLTGLILFLFQFNARAQTLETGLAMNKTHLWQTDSYLDYFSRKEGLGVSVMARYQNPTAFFLFRNNEAGFEYSRGQIRILAHTSPGGAGGDYTRIKYRSTSFTLNNYFVNFGTVSKGFQVSLGLHYNYKIITHSEGFFTVPHIGWDTVHGTYRFWDSYYYLNGKNNPFIRRFNMGPCIGIAFRPFQVGELKLRCRYDISTTLGGELKDGMNFDNLRQRFTVGIVWGDMQSDKISEKLKAKADRKKENKLARRQKRSTKISGKPIIADKNLEMGAGVNLYHFKLNRNDAVSSGMDAGFGFGIRVWDWKTKKKWPAVSLNFQQVNYNIYHWFLISSISGQFQRNTFSVGIYPMKLLLAKRRIDIRGGLDFGFLYSNKADGIYQKEDFSTGNIVQYKKFKSDIYGFNKKFTVSPLLTIAGPFLRNHNYCLKWRFTTAYNIADMRVDGLNGHGWRYQTEVVYCKSIF